MKKMFKSLIVASALVASGSVAADMFDSFNTSLGADFKYSQMKAHDANLAKITPKNPASFNFYMGGRFHENFGVEVGYEATLTSKKKTKDALNVDVLVKAKLDGFHANFNAFMPVDTNIELMAGMGLGFMQGKISEKASAADPVVRKLKRKAIIRARAGAQYLVTETMGVRALLGWDGTAGLRVKGDADKTKVLKDAISVSLGAFVKF